MSFTRLPQRGARGSSYSKKTQIDLLSIHISYEGAVDERDYFTSLKELIPKRFANIVRLYPVEKTGTISSPQHVLDDLLSHLESNNINLNKGNDLAFIVIDKDHHFDGNHQRSSSDVLTRCRQRKITVVCSNPCLEVWIISHYKDLSTEATEYLEKIKLNKDSFLKKEASKLKMNDSMEDLIRKTRIALDNEEKLLSQLSDKDSIPPDNIASNMSLIWNSFDKDGVILSAIEKS